jgi:DNA-binding response OmpR family regulator
MKILVIEDEPQLREIIEKFLKKERYIVETAPTYHEAAEKLSIYRYDFVLLDIMLPDGNGLSLLKQLQQRKKHENIIIISARDSIEDKVEGLELGADDYLSKPFHLAELAARIKSVLRRKLYEGDAIISLGNVKINSGNFTVSVNDKLVELNRKEYDILNYLAVRSERLIDKIVLAEAIWGDHIDQTDNFDFIYAQIKNLRKKLKDAGAMVEIKSVYGFGYKLIIEE